VEFGTWQRLKIKPNQNPLRQTHSRTRQTISRHSYSHSIFIGYNAERCHSFHWPTTTCCRIQLNSLLNPYCGRELALPTDSPDSSVRTICCQLVPDSPRRPWMPREQQLSRSLETQLGAPGRAQALPTDCSNTIHQTSLPGEAKIGLPSRLWIVHAALGGSGVCRDHGCRRTCLFATGTSASDSK
jgi:hypothetical protein